MQNNQCTCKSLHELNVREEPGGRRVVASHAHVNTFAACSVLLLCSFFAFVLDQAYPFVSLKCLRHADDSRASLIDPADGLPEDIDCDLRRSAWVASDGTMQLTRIDESFELVNVTVV